MPRRAAADGVSRRDVVLLGRRPARARRDCTIWATMRPTASAAAAIADQPERLGGAALHERRRIGERAHQRIAARSCRRSGRARTPPSAALPDRVREHADRAAAVPSRQRDAADRRARRGGECAPPRRTAGESDRAERAAARRRPRGGCLPRAGRRRRWRRDAAAPLRGARDDPRAAGSTPSSARRSDPTASTATRPPARSRTPVAATATMARGRKTPHRASAFTLASARTRSACSVARIDAVLADRDAEAGAGGTAIVPSAATSIGGSMRSGSK